MILLLHPTHRKLIKLLRKCVNDGGLIVLTREDEIAIYTAFKNSKKSQDRHRAVYRIFLQAIRRPQVELACGSIVLDSTAVDYIEKYLRKVELKNSCITIRNILLMCIVRFVWKTLDLKNYKDYG